MVKESVKTCSRCGKDGHNLRTCNENGKGCLMLFGVNILLKKQITGNSMKKSCSMGNISFCDIENKNDNMENPEAGYLSDGLIHNERRIVTHDRRKGKPWTEEEHRVFLAGLKKLGKGDWKGISRSFVTSRTPTQVASHAQKYFLRLGANEKRRRRPSLFDIPLSLSDQNATPKDFPVFPFERTFKNSLEPSSSQLMAMTSTSEKTPQSIDQNNIANQFSHPYLNSSAAIAMVASACFPNYKGIPSTV